MNTKKALIALALVALVGVIGATFAYFTSSATLNSEFTSGTYSTIVTEEFVSPDNWTPGTTTTKKVNITNKGSVDVAVRASYTETWTSANGTILEGVRNAEKAAQFTIGEDWERATDGYYYYKENLGTNETSTDFISSVTFNPNFQLEEGTDIECTTTKVDGKTTIDCENLTTGYAGATYSLDITIEIIQADQKWKSSMVICEAIAPTEERIYYEECVCNESYGQVCEYTNCEEVCYDREWCETCWEEYSDAGCPGACYEVIEEGSEEGCQTECDYVCKCRETCNLEQHLTIAGVQATAESPYALGATYSCDLGDGARTFYVLKEDGDNVKLIMNENIGSTVAWINKTDFLEAGGSESDWKRNKVNYRGPITANKYLATQTEGWTKLKDAGGIVELPSAQDIADAMGDKEWNSYTETGKVGPTWMQTNTDLENRCSGYWTSTREGKGEFFAWTMSCDGYLRFPTYAASVGTYTKVRPVIVIPKENMSL